MTLQTACPKPPRGAYRAARRATRQAIEAHEKREKAAVRRRDGDVCRWPGCRSTDHVETAHILAKGMGGDHGARSTRTNMLRLCEQCHRGARSLHSGDRRIEPVTPAGAEGALRFLELAEHGWRVVHEEVAR